MCALKRYDVILMDMQMPVLDGPSAARVIRASQGASRHAPIIALTANVLPDHKAKCLAAAMQAHVTKPINSSELLDVIFQHAGT